MNKPNILKLITIIAVVGLILGFSKVNFAVTSIETSGGNKTNNVINSVNNTSNNVTNNTENNTTPLNKNNTITNNTVLPDTGAKSSLGIIVLIALTSVSAIYTYVKVKEYNI